MKPERIFADTNLFLRYLTNDIPPQADAVEALLQRAEQGELLLVTNALVMAEIVWTLESFYKLPKPEVQEKVLAVLNTPGVAVVDSELVLQAVVWYVEKSVDFIDAYNASWMTRQHLLTACTFDQKHFSRFEGIAVVVPTVASPQKE
jgi:predicted nucleic acid-binding protein